MSGASIREAIRPWAHLKSFVGHAVPAGGRSFWDEPRAYDDPIFDQDEKSLFQELVDLPRM
jgi:hypothetical protein